MPKRSRKESEDINVLAKSIVEKATKEPSKEKPEKNPAAVALGRLGGLKGGVARAKKLSPKKRKEIAQKAAKARWKKNK
jgi:hypothetical protein